MPLVEQEFVTLPEFTLGF